MEANEELQSLQDEINHLAYDTFAGITGFDEFSVPCIPRISPLKLKKYCMKNGMMIFQSGQQMYIQVRFGNLQENCMKIKF